MNLKITKTFLEDVLVIEPEFYEDDRGSFFESFSAKNFSNIIKNKVKLHLEYKNTQIVVHWTSCFARVYVSFSGARLFGKGARSRSATNAQFIIL